LQQYRARVKDITVVPRPLCAWQETGSELATAALFAFSFRSFSYPASVMRRVRRPETTLPATPLFKWNLAARAVRFFSMLFSEIGDHSLSFFFPAYGNHGNLICDNLRAARDLASREQQK